MKIKTSITISSELLQQIDKLYNHSINRSLFIENAVKYYLEKQIRDKRNELDLEIINKNSEDLNLEAEDTLLYQVEN
ncbi:MAG: hypothetical protein A2086_15795 [Spirochaetes bacterium GWD1_27_9]|nr:MAG: hypothetical protein A2Z98_11065 [Spirochaetes bacterium GWB1_27_13]OHD27091.1 MAG: hypothetical protein A2Y34_11375 [Spirochaetes bacterium GWC1_27_15]OHD42842.1 MAG: hypothetical protein A2086_15795 [Spirochaetes bacterium GWD1_27_9]